MQLNYSKKLPYLHLDREEGLPSSQVHKLGITSDDHVWMATPAGLATYNGLGIKVLTQAHGLGTHGLRTVYVMENDDIIVGTDIGLDSRNSDQDLFDAVFDPDIWEYGFIECLLKNTDGSYWLGTAMGLFYLQPKTTTKKSVAQEYLKGFISSLTRDSSGNIWVLGRPFGLLKLGPENEESENQIVNFPIDALSGIECCAVNPFHKNTLLVGGSFGVHLINTATNSIEHAIPVFADASVNCMLVYGNELWLGTSSGLYLYYLSDGKYAFQQKELIVALTDIKITDIKADSIGNIWIGSHKSGTYKFSKMRSFVTEYYHPELDSVFAIRPNQNSSESEKEYLLTTMSGVFSYSQTTGVKKFEPLSDFNEHVWDINVGIDNQIWLATQSGLFVYDKLQRIRQIGKNHPICQSPARCLLSGDDGSIFVGTQSGLAHISHSVVISELKDSGYKSIGYVYCMEHAPNSHFYVGTIGNGVWFGSVLGLQRLRSEHIGDLDSVYSICLNTEGVAVILCNNKVIIKDAQGYEKILYESDSSIAGWTVSWDSPDRIWVGSSSGLMEFNVNSGELRRNISSLPGSSLWEFNFSESLYIEASHNLLCGLRGNFTVIDSEKLRELKQRPFIELQDHEWINADKFLVSEHLIKEGKWSVKFTLKSDWFWDEDSLLSRYRLVGFDEQWSELKPVADIHFNSLPSGQYNLQVQAFSPLFGWGVHSDIYAFTVKPDNRYSAVLNLFLQPLFKITHNVKSVWRNLRLQQNELDLDELVKSRLAEVEQDRYALQHENSVLEKRTNIDGLTGIANRRAFDHFLDSALQQAIRHKLEMSLILLDIDFFKAYNDTYGHLAGDETLRNVAMSMQKVMRRSGDFLARYGGEEFAIVLPLSDSNSAQILTERIMHELAQANFAHIGQTSFDRLTASLGVITVDFSVNSPVSADELIAAADKNLYQAKSEGRNKQISSIIPI